MRKLERIIEDPPIDHVRETRNDRPRRGQGVEHEGRKKEISEGDRERFISSSKGLDRFMNPIDCPVKKKRHKISSRYVVFRMRNCMCILQEKENYKIQFVLFTFAAPRLFLFAHL